jgi:hypothetical protein
MKRSSPFKRGHGLAASFVVVVAAPACKKTSLFDPDPGRSSESSYISRNSAGECTFSQNVHCPKNVSCNPPGPEVIDCPPDKRDAATDPPVVDRRPPGQSDWLRVKPRLDVWGAKCQYVPERFCAPPSKPYACSGYVAPIQVPCGKPGDAGTAVTTEPFVWKDVLGVCHRVPSLTCEPGQCKVPDGDPVPCP